MQLSVNGGKCTEKPHVFRLSLNFAGYMKLFFSEVQNTLLFFVVNRGIQAAVDRRDLLTPPAAAGVIQRHHILRAPVEIVGDEAHLTIQLLFRIQRYPSRVKFIGTS